MLPGKYVFVKEYVDTDSEIKIPFTAQDVKIIGNEEACNGGETSFYVVWLEPVNIWKFHLAAILNAGTLWLILIVIITLFWSFGIDTVRLVLQGLV